MTTTDRSGLRRVSIEASTLILVEGVDDLYFLKEFLAFCGIPDIQIEEVGGKDRFSKFLQLLLPEAPNLSQLRSLAVVRDADLDVTAAQTSVTGMLRAFTRRLGQDRERATITKAVSATNTARLPHRQVEKATVTATPHPTTDSTVIRSERYRVHFDSAQQAALCARVAGANRYVWNHMLADCIFRWRMWRGYKIGPQPSVSFFTLCRRFTVLRNDPDHAWLRALPAAEVRYALKYLADAYARYFAADKAAKARGETLPRRQSDGQPLTFPRFKSRHSSTPGFTLPDQVRLDGARLHIPKVGWVRLAGSGLYLGHTPKQVRVLKEGTEDHPKWYAHVFHEVPADRLKPPAETGAVGVDRNVRQATDSTGEVYEVPDDPQLDGKIRRKQRALSRKQGWGPKDRRPKSNRGRRVNGQLQKLQRKQKRKREDAAHQHSRKLADKAHTVVVENLNTKAMTRSAKGTVAEPGRNVKQKAGLNRAILASNWGRLDHNLAYKAGALNRVNAAYTSQTCSACGHVDKENRKTRATFKCVACGHAANADHNAAINILARAGLPSVPVSARGTGAAARRGAIPPGIPDDP